MILNESQSIPHPLTDPPNPSAETLQLLPSQAGDSDASMKDTSSDADHPQNSENDIDGSPKQIVKDGASNLAETPKGEIYIGMTFQTEEEAYEKYNIYARKIGFSIRKSKVYKRASGLVRCRYYVCYKEGFKEKDPRRSSNPKKVHKDIRTGCQAHMVIKRGEDDEFVVTAFDPEHNHPLETRIKSFTLRSHRRIVEWEKDDMEGLDGDGSQLAAQQDGGPGSVAAARLDYKSFLQNKRMEEFGKGGLSSLLSYFARKKSENLGFFYAVMVDDENQLTNFFWTDATSIVDYNHFGDVVLFDTTYRINNSGRAFASFLGVNHHMQTITFGGALLIDETTESFVWLFETWMKAMSGKKPDTILTDHCPVMEKAIATVLPETHHRICLQNIFQNAAKQLSSVYERPDFFEAFKKCIYNCDTEEELTDCWQWMINNYGMGNMKWLDELYNVRHKWASFYGHVTFYADMDTPERSESIAEFLNKFVEKKYPLTEFIALYERTLEAQRHSELVKDSEIARTEPTLLVQTRMLKLAADFYTHAAYEVFENEYKEHLMCRIEDCGGNGMTYLYEVIQENNRRGYVSCDSSNSKVFCSCKKFESVGIICCHIIKVFYHHNIHDIPARYFLKRWSRDAKSGLVTDQNGNPIQAVSNADISLRYNKICQKAMNFSITGALNEEAYSVAMRTLDDGFKKIEAVIRSTQEPSIDGSAHQVPTISREPQLIANLYPESPTTSFPPDFNMSVHPPSTQANLQPYLSTVGSEFNEETLRSGDLRLSPYGQWSFNHDKHLG